MTQWKKWAILVDFRLGERGEVVRVGEGCFEGAEVQANFVVQQILRWRLGPAPSTPSSTFPTPSSSTQYAPTTYSASSPSLTARP